MAIDSADMEPHAVSDSRYDFRVAAAACGVLHNVYYEKPTAAFLEGVRGDGFLDHWPAYGDGERIAAARELITSSLSADGLEAIERDYYQLFIGPGGMSAYPWGSVYTDRENLVCGDTTREFTHFCGAFDIRFETPYAEPEDHIGLVLAALSRLFERAADCGDSTPVVTLLGDHLLPWSDHLLARILDHAGTGYYLGFTRLLDELLSHWEHQLAVRRRQLQLYA